MSTHDMYEPLHKAMFGRLVSERRQALGLSRAQLAAKAGCSPSRLAKVERGQGNPRWHLLRALAHALDTPLSDLFVEADQHVEEQEALARRREPANPRDVV